MDFDLAERRLASDHSKLRSRQRAHANRGGKSALSAKAKREAEYRKKQYEARKAEQRKEKRRREFVVRYMRECDRTLGTVRSLAGPQVENEEEVDQQQQQQRGLMLRPTSIHGDGDKIALPPSVLASLAERNEGEGVVGLGSSSVPLAFRVGIVRDGYVFPASESMKRMMETAPVEDDDVEDASFDDDDDDDDDNMDADVSGKTEKSGRHTDPFLEEMSHRYISYTHGTVVEFTQDEGKVGLPSNIASALLDRTRQRSGGEGNEVVEVPLTRTVDPATESSAKPTIPDEEISDHDGNKMDIDPPARGVEGRVSPSGVDDNEEKTPGHLAWGAFDVPDLDVEVTMVTLPKGKGCTLIPTEEAIRNGFHNLKDVKLVLEQSLIRTRATLSVGDVVHTWHRGTKFDLHVSSVTPPDFRAVSCINTDIEVEIGSSEPSEAPANLPGKPERKVERESSFAPGVGHTLSGPPAQQQQQQQQSETEEKKPSATAESTITLPPEPPADQTDNVCTVQIRSREGATGRRRFDVSTSNLRALFAFAGSVCNLTDVNSFRLVTRFPRRVFSMEGEDDRDRSMEEAGIGAGQELFMVENV